MAGPLSGVKVIELGRPAIPLARDPVPPQGENREGWGAQHPPASPPQRRYARASPSIPSATRLAKLAPKLAELAELAELAAELAEFGLMVRTGPNPLPC